MIAKPLHLVLTGLLCCIFYFATGQSAQPTQLQEASLSEKLILPAADSNFIRRIKTPGQAITGQKLIPGAGSQFYFAAAEGEYTLISLLDSNLLPIWSQQYDFCLGDEYVLDLAVDAAGFLIGVGNSSTTVSPIQCYAFKINPLTQTVVWNSLLNSPSNSYFTRILEKRADGGSHYLLFGHTDTPGVGTGCDALLAELDRNTGDLRWTKHFTLGSCETFVDVYLENDRIYTCGRYNLNGGGQAGFRLAMTALDTNGTVLWSKHYLRTLGQAARMHGAKIVADPDGLAVVGYGTKTGTNLSNTTIQFLRTDHQGELLWARDYIIDNATSQLGYELVATPEGYLLGGTFVRPGIEQREIWLMATTADGSPTWQRTYGFDGNDQIQDMLLHNNHLYLTGNALSSTGTDMVLAKLNTDGQLGLDIVCPYIKPLALEVVDFDSDLDFTHDLTALTVTHNYATVPPPNTFPSTAFAQTICSAVGQDPCDENPNPGTNIPDQAVCFGQSVSVSAPGFTAWNWSAAGGLNCSDCETVTITPTGTTMYTLMTTDSAGCVASDTFFVHVLPLNVRSEQINFCPGETVTINGISYNSPGTVVDTLPGSNLNCDTIVTYSLAFLSDQFNSTPSINCPGNQQIVVPAGTTSVPVTFATPSASSDCPCPDMMIEQISGAASGSQFAPGLHTVCFQASDACGSTVSCCMTIQVEEAAVPCDVKTNGCIRFELLSIHQTPALDWVYRIRVTNSCNAGITYACFQLPDGTEAVEPADQSVVSGTNGTDYLVRNPNYSPFYSLRFKANNGAFPSGTSEVFRYVLPAQTDMDYIHAAVRLTTGTLVETHLNTFYCPVGQENSIQERVEAAALDNMKNTRLFPNPAVDGVRLQLSGRTVEDGWFQLKDITGKTVFESRVTDNVLVQEINSLPVGLYLYQVTAAGAYTGSGKLMFIL